MEAGGQEDNPLRTGAVAPCLADAPHQEFSAKGETQTWTPDGPAWMEHPEDRMSCQCRSATMVPPLPSADRHSRLPLLV